MWALILRDRSMAHVSIFNKRLSNNKISSVKTVISASYHFWIEYHAFGYLRMRRDNICRQEIRLKVRRVENRVLVYIFRSVSLFVTYVLRTLPEDNFYLLNIVF